ATIDSARVHNGLNRKQHLDMHDRNANGGLAPSREFNSIARESIPSNTMTSFLIHPTCKWNTDDLRALAARAIELRGQSRINIKLNLLFPRRTVQAISSVRKTTAYKRILEDLESIESQHEEVEEDTQPLAVIGESIEVPQEETHPLPGVEDTADLSGKLPSFADTSFSEDLSDEEVLSNQVILIDALKRKLIGEPRPKAAVAGSLEYAIAALESNDCDKGVDTLSNLLFPLYGTERPTQKRRERKVSTQRSRRRRALYRRNQQLFRRKWKQLAAVVLDDADTDTPSLKIEDVEASFKDKSELPDLVDDSPSQQPFDFKTDCFFCGTEIDAEEERKRSREVYSVRTLDIQESVMSACEARGDAWAEVNAAVDQGTEIPDYGGEFVQYVADNVDHNLLTLDGNDTFHGMGMIATITPGTRRLRSVPRRMNSSLKSESVYEAKSLYTDLMENTKTAEEVSTSDVLNKIRDRVSKVRDNSKAASRTSALWLQYMEMVDILRTFIKAECTANWELHLQVESQMLPYFAASGHNLYTKYAYLYLQSMKSLKDKNPEVYQEFVSGYHGEEEGPIAYGQGYRPTLSSSKSS
ncbi:hypothetical protein QZH41_018982, partial [Actinostola sp. cb2023]